MNVQGMKYLAENKNAGVVFEPDATVALMDFGPTGWVAPEDRPQPKPWTARNRSFILPGIILLATVALAYYLTKNVK